MRGTTLWGHFLKHKNKNHPILKCPLHYSLGKLLKFYFSLSMGLIRMKYFPRLIIENVYNVEGNLILIDFFPINLFFSLCPFHRINIGS
jgi:hypothetical protein